MAYRIVFTPTAKRMLAGIRDRRVRRQIVAKLYLLQQDPVQLRWLTSGAGS